MVLGLTLLVGLTGGLPRHRAPQRAVRPGAVGPRHGPRRGHAPADLRLSPTCSTASASCRSSWGSTGSPRSCQPGREERSPSRRPRSLEDADPAGLGRVRDADRARHAHRHLLGLIPGIGTHPADDHLVRGREAGLPASRAVRRGRHRGRRRPGDDQQRLRERRAHPALHAGRSRLADDRRPARRLHDERPHARARSCSRRSRTSSGR